jgi:hypothetical protein
MLSLSDGEQTHLALGIIAALFVWARWLDRNARQRAGHNADADPTRPAGNWFNRLRHRELVSGGKAKPALPLAG